MINQTAKCNKNTLQMASMIPMSLIQWVILLHTVTVYCRSRERWPDGLFEFEINVDFNGIHWMLMISKSRRVFKLKFALNFEKRVGDLFWIDYSLHTVETVVALWKTATISMSIQALAKLKWRFSWDTNVAERPPQRAIRNRPPCWWFPPDCWSSASLWSECTSCSAADCRCSYGSHREAPPGWICTCQCGKSKEIEI